MRSPTRWARSSRSWPRSTRSARSPIRPCSRLPTRSRELSAIDGAAVFFTSGGGSDAVDTAAKLARRYWTRSAAPRSRSSSRASTATTARTRSGRACRASRPIGAGYGDLVQHIENIPWGDADALERLLADHGDRVAAFIGEPVIGAGGVIPPPDGFWPRVQELCRRHDVLLISDEVICGFGRLGADFGCHRFGVDARSDDLREGPDLRLRADGRRRRLRARQGAVLGGGLERSSSATATPTAAIPPRRLRASRISRSSSARGSSSACASSSPCSRRRIRSASTGIRWSPRCARSGSPRQSSSRPRRWRRRRGSSDVVADLALDHGLIGRGLRGVAMQVSPPFVVTEEEIAEMARRLRLAVDDAMRLAPAA